MHIDRGMQLYHCLKDDTAGLSKCLVNTTELCHFFLLTSLSRPNILPDLMTIIDEKMNTTSANPQETYRNNLILFRCLHILNRTIKELANAKMLTGVKIMTEKVCFIYGIARTQQAERDTGHRAICRSNCPVLQPQKCRFYSPSADSRNNWNRCGTTRLQKCRSSIQMRCEDR
jgi:hypothetical protein